MHRVRYHAELGISGLGFCIDLIHQPMEIEDGQLFCCRQLKNFVSENP